MVESNVNVLNGTKMNFLAAVFFFNYQAESNAVFFFNSYQLKNLEHFYIGCFKKDGTANNRRTIAFRRVFK